MFSPKQTIDRLHLAHERLFGGLERLTDPIVSQPSLLPDWTVGHVLSHLARNADSVVRRLEGALHDEVVDQYPGGPASREADIQAGATRPAEVLVADIRASGLAAEHAATALPFEAWGRLSRSSSGRLRPASDVLTSRIREVEVHHVDLGLGYRVADWPADFRAELLATELPKLLDRADQSELLAWLIGRAPAPSLPAWS